MPVVQDRQISGSLVLVDDITERKSRESRLRLMENLASLTTLAAGVAHEIKNPLGSLSIHVQLIKKALEAQEMLCVSIYQARENCGDTKCLPDQYFRQMDKYLSVVNEEMDRLNAIVMDFLFAVRPMNAELRRGDFNAFIADMAEFVSVELKIANINLVLNLAENLPVLEFDASLMKQALLNLIKNAAAAMPLGGDLGISTETAEGEVLVSISDTGAGIPEENLAKIFEPYFTTKHDGTGLGLTVAFKVIKEHKGEISVRSRKGEGSIFSFTIPLPDTGRRLISFEEALPTGRVK
jgi:signal transduction histidine kinase